MTDTFLDDWDTKTLTSSCRTITAQWSTVEASVHRTSHPDISLARNPNPPGPRAPGNDTAISITAEAPAELSKWCHALTEHTRVQPPTHTDTPGLAAHLAAHAHQVAQQHWAPACAAYINELANRVLVIAEGTQPKRLADYTEAERREGFTVAKVNAEMCADFIAEHTGQRLTPTAEQIRKWGQRGHIDRYGPANKRVYPVWDVLRYCERKARRKAA